MPWSFVPLVALSIPLVLAVAALASPRRAEGASAAALVLALVVSVGAALVVNGGRALGGVLGVRVDATACVMLLLVAALGTAITRYARTYLRGDPGLERCQRWLLLTLSAVTALVVANSLLVMALCWTATSFALHRLLTFYSDRPAALVAAHKKFLVSRLADVCLASALALVHASVGSFELDRIAAWVSARSQLPLAMHFAAVLLVIAVALRSAQLPFHGWVTQVMEAPTPVSALLHAGVVNIGGFVLIRLAPWFAHAAPAQLLLVAIGLASSTVAALIMTTRVSVKVALAWSTCAQMGFMLVQCGLGLWSLALLHLVAHSLYKAHAFLNAGSAVEEWKRKAQTPKPRPVSALRLGAVAVVTAAFALLAALALPQPAGTSLSARIPDLVLALLLGVSLVPLLATRSAAGLRGFVGRAARVAGVVVLYIAWHALAEHLVPVRAPAASAVAWGLAGLGFVALFAAKSALQLRPGGPFARALHPWLFSGLYLDEVFTRLTFRVWPPRQVNAATPAPRAIHATATLEVQS